VYHLQGEQYVRFKTTASDKVLLQGSTVCRRLFRWCHLCTKGNSCTIFFKNLWL